MVLVPLKRSRRELAFQEVGEVEWEVGVGVVRTARRRETARSTATNGRVREEEGGRRECVRGQRREQEAGWKRAGIVAIPLDEGYCTLYRATTHRRKLPNISLPNEIYCTLDVQCTLEWTPTKIATPAFQIQRPHRF